MSRSVTGFNLRQYGLQRIDITAFVTLLIALVVVLIANNSPKNQSGIAQAGPPVPGLSSPHAIPMPASLDPMPGTPTREAVTGESTRSP